MSRGWRILESNKFDDILGHNFSCLAEPIPDNCPALSGEYQYNEDRGNYKCMYCLKILKWDIYDDRELFDEEEDADAGPMNEGADFTPEGINIQEDFTSDFRLRFKREDAIISLVENLADVDSNLALSVNKNQQQIIDVMRRLEESDHAAFKKSLDIIPKALAINSHITGAMPKRETLVKLKVRPDSVYGKTRILTSLLTPSKDDRVEREFLAIAKLIKMPESLALAALEEYEKLRPISIVLIPYAKHTAWLFVMAKKYGFSITQKALIELSNAPRNATRKAIKEYKDFLSNLNNANIIPNKYDEERNTEVESI